MIATRSHPSVVAVLISVLALAANAAPLDSPAERASATAGFRSLASAAGAALDSNLMTGGGTDDTTTLQRVLDRAKGGRGVHLIVDGPVLVRGLDVHANTTIECTGGGGFYLRDDANRAIIRNVNRSRGKVADKHIVIRGCFFNGNRDRQGLGVPHRSNGQYVPLESDGRTFQSGLQFFGVHYLALENLTLWNTRSFGIWIANGKFIGLSGVTVDTGLPPYPAGASLAEQRAYKTRGVNDDAVHLNGPIQYLTIDGVKLRSLDDALAVNANDMSVDDMTLNNDMGPYVGQGPITDVKVSNVMFMDAHQGVRLLSRDQRIDRVVMENLTGTVRQRVVMLSHYLNTSHVGNFGSVVFSNVAVEPVECPPYLDLYPSIKADVARNPAMWDVAEEGERPLFALNSPIENLILRQIVTRAIDGRPLIRVGSDAVIQNLSVDLSIYDPGGRAEPIKLMGTIERLSLSLDWKGAAVDRGRNPIVSAGGRIAQLRWVNTPPMYVDAELSDAHTVTVTFSQIIKATDFVKGVEIRVNGAIVPIARAVRLPDGDKIRFHIDASVRKTDVVTWAYDAGQGSVQNLDGNNLLSVAPKPVDAVGRPRVAYARSARQE